MPKKSSGETKRLSRKNYKKSSKKVSKLIMRGGEDRIKVRFFPIIKSSTIKDDYRFRDVMRWLSPDKMLGLIQHVFSGPGPDYIPTDIYWSINLNTGIPNWPIGTERRNNFEKAIRNLQRLISEWPKITHFTISDNSVTNTYHKMDDTVFEDYVDIYDGMD